MRLPQTFSVCFVFPSYYFFVTIFCSPAPPLSRNDDPGSHTTPGTPPPSPHHGACLPSFYRERGEIVCSLNGGGSFGDRDQLKIDQGISSHSKQIIIHICRPIRPSGLSNLGLPGVSIYFPSKEGGVRCTLPGLDSELRESNTHAKTRTHIDNATSKTVRGSTPTRGDGHFRTSKRNVER